MVLHARGILDLLFKFNSQTNNIKTFHCISTIHGIYFQKHKTYVTLNKIVPRVRT